jgi:hypothetical protein
MNSLFYFCIAGILGYIFLVKPYIDRRRKVLETYDSAWRLFENENGFLPIEEAFTYEGKQGVWVTRITQEIQHKNGTIGVRCRARGFAVHELNKDGTVSKRGPYFAKGTVGPWRETGNRHVVKFMRSAGGHFKSSNPSQSTGEIYEIAQNIIELKTERQQQFGSVYDFAAKCDPDILDKYQRRVL